MSGRPVFPGHPWSPDGSEVVMYYLDSDGLWQPVTGTPSEGMVPTYQADGSVAWAEGGGGTGGLLFDDETGNMIVDDDTGNPIVSG